MFRIAILVLTLAVVLTKIVAQDDSPIAREAVRKACAESEQKLTKIVIAMHNYHMNHTNKMPAHAMYDATGKKPLLSWRVSLLPYLGQASLYKKFRLNEAWDSAHNKQLLKEMPSIYVVPGVKSDIGMTHYQVFTMPVESIPGKTRLYMPVFSLSPNRVSLGQVTAKDGTSNTIAVTEATTPVEWTKPQDLVLEHDDAPLPKLGIRPNTNEFLIVTVTGDTKRIRRTLPDMNEHTRILKQMIGWKDGQKFKMERIIEE